MIRCSGDVTSLTLIVSFISRENSFLMSFNALYVWDVFRQACVCVGVLVECVCVWGGGGGGVCIYYRVKHFELLPV